MEAQIRRVAVEEWEALRDVRLSALADAPEAFGTTFAEAVARTDDWWCGWTERSAIGDGQAMYLAWHDGRPIGIAGLFRDEGRWHVISMWVAPDSRGTGVGRALLDSVVEHARAHGASEVFLSVTDGNDDARRLYERRGFVATGFSEPLRSRPSLQIRELRLAL